MGEPKRPHRQGGTALPGTLTAETIGSRLLALTLHGVTGLLVEGRVLHTVHDDAAFVVATDADALRVMGETLAAAHPETFILYIPPTLATQLACPAHFHQAYVAVRSLHGTDDLNSINVHNGPERARQTHRGKMDLTVALAEGLRAGDVYCDGSADLRGLAVFTASRSTAENYLPGRMVFKRVSDGDRR
jgi:hypothetical protein